MTSIFDLLDTLAEPMLSIANRKNLLSSENGKNLTSICFLLNTFAEPVSSIENGKNLNRKFSFLNAVAEPVRSIENVNRLTTCIFARYTRQANVEHLFRKEFHVQLLFAEYRCRDSVAH